MNLYIGGSCRGCTNSALTASYVSQLSQQGWKFIPTWVGPQSACWGGSCGSISNDPATAYNQGMSEANAAIDVAINLGLALADGSGTIIYYDLEGYDTTNTVCRDAAKSFISGWTAQLHARGSKAGVYGSSCSSAISDFASISNVTDAIWPAHWIYSSYNSGSSVWDVACLSNGLWTNHQRIRQYAGSHDETWGGVTLNIDCNVIDGIVASIGGVINPPTVTNDGGATDVTSNSARLNGEVTSTGGENPSVYIYWGDNDGGTTPASWDHQENLGTKGAGAFYKDVSGLNSGITYYYRCYAQNSAGSDWADSTASFATTVTPPPVYCSCGGTTYDEEWISRVQFNAIDKSSGGDGYADYTSISTDVARGSTYNLKVTIGQIDSWPEYVKAYFDWNQDSDFEDNGEGIEIGHCSSNGCIVSADIAIPGDATLGSTRMRIVHQYSSYHGPCGSYTYGDTEDYTVNIQS